MENNNVNIRSKSEVGNEKEENLKVMLWGDIIFTKEMLDIISMITQENDI